MAAKFNTVATSHRTTNFAGGEAFVQSAKPEFVSIALTSFLKDQFYRSANDTQARIVSLIDQVGPEFAAKTALYARQEYGMRSVSHLIASEVADRAKGKPWVKNFLKLVVRRPDDVTEILSYWMATHGNTQKKLPNAFRRGLGGALSKFNEYSLSKYKGEGKGVTLVDAVNLLHPKHTEALGKLVKGTLAAPDTWEVGLTRAGNADDAEEAKGAEWKRLVVEDKLGYIAMLRNLRNILKHAPDVVNVVAERLKDPTRITKALVFPFQFITALDIVQKEVGPAAATLVAALSDAVDVSVGNVPVFDGTTLVVLDTSGSMTSATAQGGQTAARIGSIFAATLYKANLGADLMKFSDNARYVTLNRRDSLLTLAKNIPFASGGTNFHAIFTTASRKYDRIIILSDMQGWIGGHAPTSSFAQYKARLAANPKIYSFDLAGYGSLQFPERNVYALAGFSDKTLDTLRLLETDHNAMVNLIEAVTFE
jgi:60 kDa SS-A/Ro ribonucleoprotein